MNHKKMKVTMIIVRGIGKKGGNFMAGTIEKMSHAAQRQTFKLLIDHFYDHIDKAEDRTKTYLKLVDQYEKFMGDGSDKKNVEAVRKAFQDPNNRWVKFLNKVIDETESTLSKKLILNLR